MKDKNSIFTVRGEDDFLEKGEIPVFHQYLYNKTSVTCGAQTGSHLVDLNHVIEVTWPVIPRLKLLVNSNVV